MVYLYSGTPGSGKSYHAVVDCLSYLKSGKNVITNFDINPRSNKLKKRLVCKDLFDISPDFLYEFARLHHRPGKEGQSLLIIDEAGLLFNSREYQRADRMNWIKFLQTHRHYGFNVLLISQMDRMIDRQIRGFIESEHKHRALKHYGFLGAVLSLLFGGLFISIEYWYGCRLMLSRQLIVLRRRYYKMYNSYDSWR